MHVLWRDRRKLERRRDDVEELHELADDARARGLRDKGRAHDEWHTREHVLEA